MRTLYPYYQEPTPVWDSDLESPLWHPAAAALRVFTGAPSGGPFMAQPPAASPSAARGSSVISGGSGPDRNFFTILGVSVFRGICAGYHFGQLQHVAFHSMGLAALRDQRLPVPPWAPFI